MNKRKHTDFAAYLQENHYSASTVTDYVNALGAYGGLQRQLVRWSTAAVR